MARAREARAPGHGGHANQVEGVSEAAVGQAASGQHACREQEACSFPVFDGCGAKAAWCACLSDWVRVVRMLVNTLTLRPRAALVRQKPLDERLGLVCRQLREHASKWLGVLAAVRQRVFPAPHCAADKPESLTGFP